MSVAGATGAALQRGAGPGRPMALLAGCALALLLAVLLSLSLGKFALSPAEVLAALLGTGEGDERGLLARTVLWQLRLPRLLAGMLLGLALGASGAAFQTMFRNPLVSPDILGVSAGCGLGAALAILMGWPGWAISATGFGGGLSAVALVMGLSRRTGGHEPTLVMVLSGVAVGALLGAGIALVKLLADPGSQLPAITFWLMGGLHAVSREELQWALPLVGLAVTPLVLIRWQINLLGLPDDEARSMGASLEWLRPVVVASATLMTAAVVAMAGIVGWVGLLVPHVARRFVGPDFGALLPASMLIGALFVVLADTAARTLAPIELPLSVLTSALGAPFFLWLLGRRSASP